MDEPLTLTEQFGLRIHLFICEFCEKFQQQLSLLRQTLSSKSMDLDESESDSCVPPGAKDRLREKLRQHRGDSADDN